MTVYIKGMEIPKGCRDCRFEDWGNCTAVRPVGMTRHMSEEREVYCPLIEIPEPHGRLIDADEFYDYVTNQIGGVDCIKILEAPTVIEGSE